MELRPITPLCELAKKYETDKGGRHLRYGGGDSDTCHEYTPVYWDLLGAQREHIENVLEIGINAGSSLRMWEEFFPKAQIFGVDCNPNTLINVGRIHSAQADQNSPDSLKMALDWFGPRLFDLIVDDGSHELEHQITSVKTLVHYLSPHGIYVVEDLQVDCHPEFVAAHIPDGFKWRAIPAPGGIGKAHCPCGDCGGTGPEQLLVITRG